MSRPKGSKNKKKENKGVELPSDYVSFNNVQIANADGTTTPLIPKKKRGRPYTKPNSIDKVEGENRSNAFTNAARGRDASGINEDEMRVGDDIICPTTGEHCDDECCTVGATCNLSGSGDGISKPEPPTESITDKITPHIKKMNETAIKLSKAQGKKPTLSPFMLQRQKAKGGGQ